MARLSLEFCQNLNMVFKFNNKASMRFYGNGLLLHHHPAGSHRQPCQVLYIIINQTQLPLKQYNSLVNISGTSGPMGHSLMLLQPAPIDSASLSPAESFPSFVFVCALQFPSRLSFRTFVNKCLCVHWMCGLFPARSSAYHLYTLHQRQAHRLVTAQRDHAGWRVGCGLKKGKNSLHTHTTGLCEQTHTDKTASSSLSKHVFVSPVHM